MLFYDATKISTRKITDEGYLQVSALAARPGIQNYSYMDFPAADLPGDLQGSGNIRILRPAEVVKDSAPGFSFKPVTIDHPSEQVNASNYRKYSVGIVTDSEVIETGDIKARLTVQDANAIRVIDSGKKQVSLGYDADIDWTGGTDDTYGDYDAVMTNITGNHLAIVDRARAGSAYRLFDKHTVKEQNMPEIKDAEMIRENEQLKIAVKDAETEHEKTKSALTDAETKLATVSAELETVKKQIVTDAEISERVETAVNERLAVIDSARKVMPDLDTAGKSTSEIQLAVIDHLTGGNSKPEGASIAVVYDAVTAINVSKTETIQSAITTKVDESTSVADSARAEMIARRAGKQE